MSETQKCFVCKCETWNYRTWFFDNHGCQYVCMNCHNEAIKSFRPEDQLTPEYRAAYRKVQEAEIYDRGKK